MMPPSLSAPTAQAAPSLVGATHPRRYGGDANERGGTYALRLPHDKPAPRTLLPIGQRSRLAASITASAGALLPHPFTPYQCAGGRLQLPAAYVPTASGTLPPTHGGTALCCRLASRQCYHHRAPAYGFAG